MSIEQPRHYIDLTPEEQAKVLAKLVKTDLGNRLALALAEELTYDEGQALYRFAVKVTKLI